MRLNHAKSAHACLGSHAAAAWRWGSVSCARLLPASNAKTAGHVNFAKATFMSDANNLNFAMGARQTFATSATFNFSATDVSRITAQIAAMTLSRAPRARTDSATLVLSTATNLSDNVTTATIVSAQIVKTLRTATTARRSRAAGVTR